MKLASRMSRIGESATLRVSRKAGELRRQGVEVADFSAGEPDFAPPKAGVEAAVEGLRGGFTRYTASSGIPELREALAERYAAWTKEAYEPEIQPDGSSKAVNGGIVGFFSLEMAAEQLATRILAEKTEISSEKLRRGEVSNEDFGKIVRSSQEIEKLPFYIDDTPGLTIAALAVVPVAVPPPANDVSCSSLPISVSTRQAPPPSVK